MLSHSALHTPPVPHLGTQTADSLDAWRRRHINVITWSAVDMLYNQRQQRYYGQDADLPMGPRTATALLPPKASPQQEPPQQQ